MEELIRIILHKELTEMLPLPMGARIHIELALGKSEYCDLGINII